MTDPTHDPSDVQPLEYRTPPAPQRSSAAAAMQGFACGLIMTALAGCFTIVTTRIPRAVATNGSIGSTTIYPHPAWPGWAFAVLAAGSLCAVLVMRRAKPRNLFYLGLAAGLGVTALCEGLCFVIS